MRYIGLCAFGYSPVREQGLLVLIQLLLVLQKAWVFRSQGIN